MTFNSVHTFNRQLDEHRGCDGPRHYSNIMNNKTLNKLYLKTQLVPRSKHIPFRL